jgi:hypothetical protein
VKLGNPGLALSIYGDDKRIFRLDFERISSKYNYLLFVSQAETERMLREALDKAGVTIERNLTLTMWPHGSWAWRTFSKTTAVQDNPEP